MSKICCDQFHTKRKDFHESWEVCEAARSAQHSAVAPSRHHNDWAPSALSTEPSEGGPMRQDAPEMSKQCSKYSANCSTPNAQIFMNHGKCAKLCALRSIRRWRHRATTMTRPLLPSLRSPQRVGQCVKMLPKCPNNVQNILRRVPHQTYRFSWIMGSVRSCALCAAFSGGAIAPPP